ncbi:hypothetical protein GCM10009756_01150 [Pseudokineococcus marinus]
MLRGVGAGDDELRVDTTGLRAAYLAEGREPLLSPGGARALRGLVVAVAAVLGLAALRGADAVAHLVGVGAFGLGGELLARALDRTTRITPTHLDVRPAGRRRVVAWDDVRELVPPGRLGDGGHALLADGTAVPLPHVPREDVERLTAALAAAREEHRTGAADGEAAGG